MSEQKLTTLYNLLQAADLDAAALNPGSTLTYMTGLHFHLMERPIVLLLAQGATPTIILPQLETGKASASSIPLQHFPYGENPDNWSHAFQQACDSLQLNGKTVGVEPTRMRVLELRFLEEAAPEAKFTPADKALTSLRIQKDEQEITHMRQAVKIAQHALSETLPLIRINTSEREIASELTMQLLRAGSESGIPFSPIVASGPNSANPHSTPSDRPIAPGDLLLFDWGASYQGYCSDITRTFAVGEIDPELRKIFQIVAEANAAGRHSAAPDIEVCLVDLAARDIITLAGYGNYFIHRTGHGLGMESHEPPYIHSENTMKFSPGMTFTIEPGIYLPDRGGVRIEDNVIITADGAESLTDFPRELTTIG